MGKDQFAKGGNCYPPLWQRGARGDFLIKPLNISVLHRAINAICRSSTNSKCSNDRNIMDFDSEILRLEHLSLFRISDFVLRI